jgi:Raf kinase inhibitor-like YbhB/YbcL family protein
MSLTLTSPSFSDGQPLPAKHAYRLQNLSPALAWGEPPAGTQSFALLVDDPDAPAGDWVHWVLWNLPAATRELPEGVAKEARRADGSQQGKNDFGNLGWDGPAPPSGTHHYHFKLLALDQPLPLAAGAGKKELLTATQGHELARAELVGTFTK